MYEGISGSFGGTPAIKSQALHPNNQLQSPKPFLLSIILTREGEELPWVFWEASLSLDFLDSCF